MAKCTLVLITVIRDRNMADQGSKYAWSGIEIFYRFQFQTSGTDHTPTGQGSKYSWSGIETSLITFYGDIESVILLILSFFATL